MDRITPLSPEEKQRLLASGVAPDAVATLERDRAFGFQKQTEADQQAEFDRMLTQQTEPSTVKQFEASEAMSAEQEALAATVPVDALELFDDDTLVKNPDFSLEAYVKDDPAVLQDNKKTARLASIWAKRNAEPITAEDVWKGTKGLPYAAVKQLYGLAKGVGTMLYDVVSTPAASAIGAVTGQGDDFQQELSNKSDKDLASDLAGLEKGTFNFATWATRAPKNVARRFFGYDSWDKIPPERLQEEFRSHMGEFLQGEEIGKGKGEFAQAVAGETIKEVEARGDVLDKGRVESVAAADPVGFVLFGKAFQAGAIGASLGKQAVKATVGKAIAPAIGAGAELAKLRSAVAKLRREVPASSPALKYSEELLASAEKDVGVLGKVSAAVQQQADTASRLLNARLKARLTGEAVKRFNTPGAKDAAEKAAAALADVEASIGALSPSRAIAKASQVQIKVNPATIAQRVVGRAIQAAGAAARAVGGVARAIPPIAVGGIVASQLMSGNILAAIGALAGGRYFQAGRLGRLLQKPFSTAGKAVQEAGKRVATGTPATDFQKALIGLSRGTGETVAEGLKGIPMDVGFGLALAETPEDVRQGMPAFGTAFKVAHSIGRPFSRAVQAVKIGPRQIQDPGAVQRGTPGAPIKAAADIDAASRKSLQADPEANGGYMARLNAVEKFLQGAGSDTPVYIMPSPAEFEEVLLQQHRARTGREPTPEEAARIKNYSEQRGIFSEEVVGDNGKEGSAIFITDMDAAPHEGAHAFQFVLGEKGNQFVDRIIRDHYGDQWEEIGAQYTARLNGTPLNQNWRAQLQSIIPDSIKREAGGDPVEAADIYLAREIGAENFSTLFEAKGGDPGADPTLTAKLAGVVERTAALLGTDLLANFQTPGGIGISPSGKTMSAIEQQAQAATPTSPAPAPQERPQAPSRPPAKVRGTAPPVTPEQQQADADQAREIADAAPDTTLPGASMNQREILGEVADAIASGEGVNVEYRSAPEAPGADIEAKRASRRAEIEAARNLSEEDRRSIAKNVFPYRIAKTSGGVTQVMAWSPDMLASNALRTARALSELAVKDPNNPVLKEITDIYGLDIAKGEWTEQGWRDILRDATIFSENQLMGATGMGTRLVVPESVRSSGAFAPPETGTPSFLEPGRADFINILYNIRPPETSRITGRRLPGNIIAQRISEATQPGRTGEPAKLPGGVERQPFIGERARELGIEGTPIKEVNPLRAKMEKALQSKDVALPEGIEVIQRLNLEHMAFAQREPNLPRTAGGNIQTLRAGFLPARSREGYNEVDKMSPLDYVKYAKEAEARPGGATGDAYEMGKAAGPEIIPLAEAAMAKIPEQRAAAMKEFDLDSAFALANKSAFYAEVIKGAKGERMATATAQAAPRRVTTAQDMYRELQRIKAEKEGRTVEGPIEPREVSRAERNLQYQQAIAVRKADEAARRSEEKPSRKVVNEFYDSVEGGRGLVDLGQSREFPNGVTLHNIEVPEGQRGTGVGSRLLRKITDLADKHGVTVDLDVGPDTAGIGLIDWYTRHGFKFDAEGDFMVRQPKPVDRKKEAQPKEFVPPESVVQETLAKMNDERFGGMPKGFTADEKFGLPEEPAPEQLTMQFSPIGELRAKAKRGEALTDEERVELANSTSRNWNKLTVAAKTLTENVTPEEGPVLDFGAGKGAIQTGLLRNLGYNVTAHEFGGNVQKGLHDPEALSRKYPVVMASNVLNVQSSEGMFDSTMKSLQSALQPGGRIVANFPSDPRYLDQKAAGMQERLNKYFDSVERIGGSGTEPVWSISKPKTTDQKPTVDDIPIKSDIQPDAIADQSNVDFSADVKPTKTGKAVGADSVGIRKMQEEGVPVNEDGSLNAGAALQMLPRVDEWVDRYFRNNEEVKRAFSKGDMEDFIQGMKMTEKIFGDYKAFPEEEFGEDPHRSNSDKLFKITFDLSTICPQQDQYVKIISTLEKENGRIFTPKERFMIGEMLAEAGATACWFCYGQAGRNVFDNYVGNASNVFNEAMALPDLSPASVAPLFKKYSDTKKGWTMMSDVSEKDPVTGKTIKDPTTGKKIKAGEKPGALYQTILTHAEQAKATGFKADPVRMRDIARGLEKPASPLEAAIAEGIRDFSQSSSKANAPKGYAPYRDQVLGRAEQIRAFNKSAGVRMNSQTDFRMWHVLDVAQWLSHLQTVGGMAHVYTRKPEFIRIFGDTGIKFNMSTEVTSPVNLPIRARVNKMTLDQFREAYKEHGDPDWNSMNSFPEQAAKKFRQENSNAGTMLVAIDEYQLWWGLESPNIDMIIPYHKGAVKSVMENHKAARDFSSEQHEDFGDWKAGETRKATMPDGRVVELTMPKDKKMVITREQHNNTREDYLAMAEQMGFTPRFERFSQHPNYMKLVRDVARNPSEQKVIDASKINFEEASKLVDEWIHSERFKDETAVNPGLLKLVRERLASGDLPPAALVESKLATKEQLDRAKNLEHLIRIQAKDAKAAAKAAKIKPPTGPGMPSVFKQIEEIKRKEEEAAVTPKRKKS